MAFNFPQIEESILKFWNEKKIFEKSLEHTKEPKKGKRKDFVFYDGPPFATGLPHYGHILSSVAKDVFPRYKTMQGFYVRRRWGWDCHGLPIENIVEKDLGISGKKEIENKIGVGKFNEACRSKVLTYTAEWKKMVDRIGRWIDFDNSYKTMDSTYMESVWWALKTLWDKGLVYEGKKVLMYCPRCETPVSKAEVAMDNSYKDVTEEAVTVKFKLKNPEKIGLPENTFILAWTTTPWTLPGNVALAVGEKIKYEAVKIFANWDENGKAIYNWLIAAEDRINKERNNPGSTNLSSLFLWKAVPDGFETPISYTEAADLENRPKHFIGKDLLGLEYEPLYEIPAVKNSGKKAWYIAPADFVNTEDGTGIVHTAVIYGEDDYNLGVKIDLPMVQLLDSKGIYNNEAPEFLRGKYIKSAEKEIKEDLQNRGLLFAKNQNTHPYPFCWRCGTQLFYNAVSSWFINIQKHKNKIIKLNEKINWYPEHLKHGRFLNIIQDAPDWNISRNRYWATPLPFFKCECGNVECVGSTEELKEKSVNFSEVFNSDEIAQMDLHKDKIDRIKIKCTKCKKEIQRIPEVIDCWVESASMPFAELHYPFENNREFKDRLPAQYIAEYIAQTRTWFYYMHVLAVLLFDSISFENVISTGTVLNEKGEKLSKSKKNFKDPWEIIGQYGMDALRFYLMSSPVMASEDLFFNEKDVKDTYNKVINSLCNCAEFYSLYAKETPVKVDPGNLENILDKWIISKLNNLILNLTETMDKYDTIKSCRLIKDFIEDLSLWYVRRSRDRFKEESEDKDYAQKVLGIVLESVAKIISPILPYTAEFVYEKISAKEYESVHLSEWPGANKKLTNKDLEEKMDWVRNAVGLALAERASKSIKVRQPLASLKIKNVPEQFHGIVPIELAELVKDEINVKEILVDKDIATEVELDLNITPELKEEGVLREIVRAVQGQRKEAGLVPTDKITVVITAPEYEKNIVEKNKEKLLSEFRATEITTESGAELKIQITKI